ncbi:MAG TPA: response regulator [Anaerolineales bacterium]|nr:response regulator [Anaerolineales bacterium]
MTNQDGYLLIVEDVPDILELLYETLKFKGYRVVTAKNGEEALEAVQKERPALIVTDILMPKMDGFNLVHKLRLDEQTREIPIVFLTATYVAPEDKEFALTIGVTRFVEKPVDLEDFYPLIEELLNKGTPPPLKPLDEVDFYEGYKKRLETKLKHKNTQIVRDQHLLKSVQDSQKTAFKASMANTLREKEEIQGLLEDIRDKLDKLQKKEE